MNYKSQITTKSNCLYLSFYKLSENFWLLELEKYKNQNIKQTENVLTKSSTT